MKIHNLAFSWKEVTLFWGLEKIEFCSLSFGALGRAKNILFLHKNVEPHTKVAFWSALVTPLLTYASAKSRDSLAWQGQWLHDSFGNTEMQGQTFYFNLVWPSRYHVESILACDQCLSASSHMPSSYKHHNDSRANQTVKTTRGW